MPGIVEFPTVVQDAVEVFGPVFANEPERRHFAEYLTGLMVADRKNVSGINSEFAVTTDQSCLNRWINEVDWDPEELNEKRLAHLQRDPTTRYSKQGVIAIDNTLVDHHGKLIEDVGYFWDHAEKRYLIAHDYLIANYVCTSGKHYAVEFRRFRKRDACEAKRDEIEARPGGFDKAPEDEKKLAEFKTHTVLFQELVDWAVEQGIPGAFAFDSYFTNAPNMNYTNGKGRAYVGDLKFNRKILVGGREIKAEEFARSIPPEDRKQVKAGGRRQWYFTKTIRFAEVGHRVRILILWDRKNAKEPAKIMVTNRTYWEVTRILRVYRKRWTGTETFHRDGKQHLGMGDCQLRNGEGQTRHMYLVMLAHSLLVSQMRQGRAREWAHGMLTTIGEACRAVLRETLGTTIAWAIDRATSDGWDRERIEEYLALT